LPSHSVRSRKRRDAAPQDVRIAVDAFRAIVQALRAAGRDAEQRAGLSAAQLFALHELNGRAGISVNELAARTYTHQSSVSVVLRRLVDQGLVRRRPSIDDGRRVQLEVTAAGARILRSAPDPIQQRLIAAIGTLPRGRRALVARTLRSIAVHITGGSRRPAMFFEEGRRSGRRRKR
jgi:DNA-binding MarR family transcriptional regulator